jgi:ABC-type hemin transport system ATPase subunit
MTQHPGHRYGLAALARETAQSNQYLAFALTARDVVGHLAVSIGQIEVDDRGAVVAVLDDLSISSLALRRVYRLSSSPSTRLNLALVMPAGTLAPAVVGAPFG